MTSFHSRLRHHGPFDLRPWILQPPPPPPPPRGLSRYASMQQLDVTMAGQSSPTSDDSDRSPVQQHTYQRKRTSDDGYSSSSYAAASTPISVHSNFFPSHHYIAAAMPPRSPWPQSHAPATISAGSFAMPGGLRKMDEERTVYRQPAYGSTGQANGDFCANSFVGYHQAVRQSVAFGSTWSLAMDGGDQMANCVQPTAASAVGQGPTFDDFPRDVFVPQVIQRLAKQRHSKEQSFWKLNSWKVLLSLMLLIVIIGALVAIVVVTISKVQTHNSVLKLVRQYQGTLRIVDGSLLDFDAKMLDTKSTKFAERAAQIEQRIDGLFDYSGLASIYEGSTVTGFRFVVEVPALEVQFNIKTKVDVDLNVIDLLTIIRDSVRDKGFADAKVDINSLVLEDQRLPSVKNVGTAIRPTLPLSRPKSP